MTFDEALGAIASQLGLNVSRLRAYAGEDDIPGSEGLDPRAIPYTADGKLLYALIRALKPARVLETGTCEGGSASHIAAALAANDKGRLLTIDIREDGGQYIDKRYREYVDVQQADVRDFCPAYHGELFDFIHEDTSHLSDTVWAVYANLPTLLNPGGVVVSHDTASGCAPYIMQAITGAGFPEPPTYLYDGSPCGFGIMRYQP